MGGGEKLLHPRRSCVLLSSCGLDIVWYVDRYRLDPPGDTAAMMNSCCFYICAYVCVCVGLCFQWTYLSRMACPSGLQRAALFRHAPTTIIDGAWFGAAPLNDAAYRRQRCFLQYMHQIPARWMPSSPTRAAPVCMCVCARGSIS